MTVAIGKPTARVTPVIQVTTDDATVGTAVSVVWGSRRVMTAAFRISDPQTCICGDCRGTRFDKRPGCRGKCQRCRGRGFTTVGTTKR